MSMRHGTVGGRAVAAGNASTDDTDTRPAGLGDPAADPVLTVRIQPPDTRARRLDLNTPRAVKVADPHSACAWVVVNAGYRDHLWRTDREVADWPYAVHVEIGAAQRLAHPDHFRRDTAAAELPADECERPFR